VTEIVLSFDEVRIVSVTGKAGAAVIETRFPLLAEGAHVRTFQTVSGRDATGQERTTRVVSVLTPDRSFELHLDSSRVKSVQFARERFARNHGGGRSTTDFGSGSPEGMGVEAPSPSEGDEEDTAIHSIRWLDANNNVIMNMVIGMPAPAAGETGLQAQHIRAEAIAAWAAMRDKYGEWLDVSEEL
jgi:hypothetical protein